MYEMTADDRVPALNQVIDRLKPHRKVAMMVSAPSSALVSDRTDLLHRMLNTFSMSLPGMLVTICWAHVSRRAALAQLMR